MRLFGMGPLFRRREDFYHALAAELDELEENGVAFDGEERAEGIRCVATPIIDHDGHPHRAVSVSAPTSRLTGNRLTADLPEMLQGTADVITINMTFS